MAFCRDLALGSLLGRGKTGSRRSYTTKLGGHFNQGGKGVRFHLLHYLSPMRFHCDLADAEFATNLFIQQAGNDQRHNLAFARGE